MNYDRKSEAKANIEALAAMIREYVAANCDDVDEGFEISHSGYMAFVEYRIGPDGGSATVVDVWDKAGNECPDIADALHLSLNGPSRTPNRHHIYSPIVNVSPTATRLYA